ncbi:MAG: isocitrate dehydrogenase (NADP(+)) [Woeseia sp.]|nr:isocitrate dehydrogenase (NADP(+)) [Woeseia sp.]|tara:strand:- start:254 stop:2479 length:2226 start_codon:yes stop_codon:yes gene_type:complete
MNERKIIYTITDEAPMLATHSLLPIVKVFTAAAGICVETRDISLAGRIIASFPDQLSEKQKQTDSLAELAELAQKPTANIIKLPNISASIPQLKAAISELQTQGYDVPDYPDEPGNDAETAIKERYSMVLGSAVNPVLRDGNSDRRVAESVKQYAKKHPHSMGEWRKDSKSRIAHMESGDFYANEKSVVIKNTGSLKIKLKTEDGKTNILKDNVFVLKDDIVDASVMSSDELRKFFVQTMEDCKKAGALLSLHLKATMMRNSDPVIFGHAVAVYFKDLFDQHTALFEELGVNQNNGIGDVCKRIANLPAKQRAEIEADILAVYENQPPLAMVDSDNGITNLHVPSDVIIDASIPAAVRSGGQMWDPDGCLADTHAMIPDRCYAGIYEAVFEDCQKRGKFDVTTMGNVCNVGLMAKKAEEYGSHDKTFEIPVAGKVVVTDEEDRVLLEHKVSKGDIWRMCETKDIAVKDWIGLAVKRARATGVKTIFWLDQNRPHDENLIRVVSDHLKQHNRDSLDIQIMNPIDAMSATLDRVRAGQDTVSVTGNVLRDYLTDLFPILELGTSAKMLSIVPLLAGGGLYETGAGGSAPKHVRQFLDEGHLRWDSLGEFLALAVSIEDIAIKSSNEKARVLGMALDTANSKFLENNKAPSRKVNELDNRGSHYYLATYWAEALANQQDDPDLSSVFAPLAKALMDQEEQIIEEFNAVQGMKIDIGGYYHPDEEKVFKAMRPSAAFNAALDALS